MIQNGALNALTESRNRKGPASSVERGEPDAENVASLINSEDTIKLAELLASPEIMKMIESLDLLNENAREKTEKRVDMVHNDASNVPNDPNKNGKVLPLHTETDEPDGENDVQKELNALLRGLEPKPSIMGGQSRGTDPALSLPPLLWNLLNTTKNQLAGMKAFASFAKDKFEDAELGKRYQKTLLEHIAETTSLLDCYADYLRLSNPETKTDTIHTLIEETLTQHKAELKAREVVIIKKQFQKDLPETTIPEAQLRYILQTLMRYVIQTAPLHGSLGLLTRLVDSQDWNEDEYEPLKRDGKHIEILFVFSHQEKKGDRQTLSRNGKGMELILHMVREILLKNKGVMKVKPSDKEAMTFISLMLPIERRPVFQFPVLTSVEKMSHDYSNDGRRQAR